MKLFKNYKKLYEAELLNRGLLIDQNSKLSKERIEMEKRLKKTIIDLEDTEGFLAQEKEAKEALLKERTKLRKMITKLGGDWKDGK